MKRWLVTLVALAWGWALPATAQIERILREKIWFNGPAITIEGFEDAAKALSALIEKPTFGYVDAIRALALQARQDRDGEVER